MDISTLAMAYGAAVLVALTVTAAFSTPIEEVLFRLLPQEVVPAWQQFVKFALFVVTFGGGIPSPLTGAIIDRGAPASPPMLPGENFMIVMSSLSGALMAAAWVLLVFFAVTLALLTGLRLYTLMRKRREVDSGGGGGEPLKRREPTEPRPLKQERPSRRW